MASSKKLLAKRAATLDEIEKIASAAAAENRELTAEEVTQRDALVAKAEDYEERAFTARVDESIERRDKAAQARNDLGLGNQTPNSTGLRVKNNERTYRKGGPVHYMNDLVLKAMGDSFASERLSRHAHEMAVEAESAQARMNAGSPRAWDAYFVKQVRAGMGSSGLSPFEAQYRALSTANGAGGEFVPPLFLTEEYVPFARPGRVFADACHKEDLPPGTMSMNIPKVTGGTSVDTQGSQNSNVSDTDLTTQFVTFPVVTVAGQQVLSLQLLERSPIAFDDVTFRDLHMAMAQRLDYKCLNGPGSGDIQGVLNSSGVIAVTWNTGGSGGVKGLYGVIANAKGQIASARFLPATHAFMTPDRWEWIEQQVDANGRPLVVPDSNGAFALAQVAPDPAVAEGLTGGRMLGLNVNQDFNIPANLGAGTNQDAILVVKADDLYLYESPVVARALPQTYGNQLSILLQVYEYAAFTAERYPVSSAYITGTEMTNPVTFNT